MSAMPAVAFHFNVSDRQAYACRLLRKAVRQGAQVAVTGPDRLLHELDRQLWVFDTLEFVPHWRGSSPAQMPPRLAGTPVVLVSQPDPTAGHTVLLNLADTVAPGSEAFARVIEIVGQDEGDRQAARARWRDYTARGWPIERHDVAA